MCVCVGTQVSSGGGGYVETGGSSRRDYAYREYNDALNNYNNYR